MPFSEAEIERADACLAAARDRGFRLATAESCTGGLVSALLTAVPGSSDVMERGVVTYSNAAKQEMLGVPAELIEARGAVSGDVAAAMARGLLDRGPADFGLAVTGIAGPGGGTEEKPVGLVYLAGMQRGKEPVIEAHRFGDVGRAAVRRQSVIAALTLLEGLFEGRLG